MSNYPGITLEEAEIVAGLLGYNIPEECNLCMDAPVSPQTVDAYIFNLLGGMFGDFEEHYEGKTWADCPPTAKAFYDRANAAEIAAVVADESTVMLV